MQTHTLKKKLYSSGLIAVALTLLLTPFVAVYAASSGYSFSMLMRVDGCGNNQHHPLDSGTAKITGSSYTPSSSGIPIQYTLYRDTWPFNQSFGTVNGGVNTSFSNLQFPTSISVSANNYCLEIWRGSSDGITVTGSGTLHN